MGALDNLKILDFTTLLPGPYATLMLADMGAEVLKIASASRYDLVAGQEPFVADTEVSANQAWLGRNKKSIFLNLKSQQAIDIVKRLILDYDIIIEQFRPGVMDKLGLGYEELSKLNPKLIYCSLTGYGQTGPLKDAAGHDINYISRSGIISHAGRKEDGPSLMNFQIADIAVGSMNSVIGILAAVNSRNLTGKGQYIDISMMDGCIPFNSLSGAAYLVSNEMPSREGELLNGGSLYDFYETADGEYMSVGALEPKFFESFCTAINRPDLIKETATPADVQKIKNEIRSIFKEKTKAEWTSIFKDFDACVQPVLNLQEAFDEDEQIKEREMIVEVSNPLKPDSSIRQMANPIKFSDTRCEYKFAGYPLGYHTKEIIEALGYDYEKLKHDKTFD